MCLNLASDWSVSFQSRDKKKIETGSIFATQNSHSDVARCWCGYSHLTAMTSKLFACVARVPCGYGLINKKPFFS